ncbi:MAG: triosephosphate isomerase [Candidatus Aenigmarchaeota archaeon]|nr:triosephosphate isomerase [Candidatus Aenigmarchaeota archaeon]
MNKIIAANWKMNKSSKEAEDFLRRIEISDKNTVIIFPSFTALPAVSSIIGRHHSGAQNVFYEEKGAYTGEISPVMVKEFADYALVGHSERRALWETDEIIGKKVRAAQNAGLKVLLCVGEAGGQDRNRTLETQLRKGLMGANEKNIVIAYEPVWAIGTGLTAKAAEIAEAVSFIKALHKCSVIYGGSVTASNAKEMLSVCDGLLVGGASLDAEGFRKIIEL